MPPRRHTAKGPPGEWAERAGSGSRRGGDPHRAAVGLHDLGDDGIPHPAAEVVPGKGVARTRVALQRPALVVMGTASAEGVSRVHVLDGRAGATTSRRNLPTLDQVQSRRRLARSPDSAPRPPGRRRHPWQDRPDVCRPVAPRALPRAPSRLRARNPVPPSPLAVARHRRGPARRPTTARGPARRPTTASGGAPARRLAGLLAVCALAVAGALGSLVTSASPASAHASLIKATPADGATLTSAPTQVVLQFDDPVSTSFATLVVTGPDGHDVMTGKPSVSGSTVTGDLEGGLAPGAYRTSFRVVSDDGHPVSGQLRFTLRLPATASPSASAPAGSGTPSPQPTPTGEASPNRRGGHPGRPHGRRSVGRAPVGPGRLRRVPGRAVVVVRGQPAAAQRGADDGRHRRRGPALGPPEALSRTRISRPSPAADNVSPRCAVSSIGRAADS